MDPTFFLFKELIHEETQTKKLILRNTSKKDVVFKIRQSCPLSIKVKSHAGAIRVGKCISVNVTMNSSFSVIESRVDKIYLDVYCQDINKTNIKERRGWLYNDNHDVSQLSHRFIIKQSRLNIPPTMVINLPGKAILVGRIVVPIDYASEEDVKTCYQIDKGIAEATSLTSRDKAEYDPSKSNGLFFSTPVMRSHNREKVEHPLVGKIIDEKATFNAAAVQHHEPSLLGQFFSYLFPASNARDPADDGYVSNDDSLEFTESTKLTDIKYKSREHRRSKQNQGLGVCGI
uniref:Major sperm protein n=1 Tax=Rhabditophanes sp. KR3021 TaxID=114890 RepID=A0AC35UHC2_9BILA